MLRHRTGASPRRHPDEQGAAAVEFALVAPLLLILVFGMISYGYMLSFRQAISQAATEGARAAAVTPGGIANADLLVRARQATNESLTSYGVTCSTSGTLVRGGRTAGTCAVDLSATCQGSTTGAKCVRVTLEYRYRDNSLLPDVGYGYVMPTALRYVAEVQVA